MGGQLSGRSISKEYSKLDYFRIQPVLQSFTSRPFLLIIFINKFYAELKSILSNFEDNAELVGAVDFLESREVLQMDLDKL